MKRMCNFCFLFVLCFVGDVVLSEGLSEARISAIEKTLREQAEKLEDQTLEITQLKKTVLSQNEEIADLKKTVLNLKRTQYGQKHELSLLKSLIQRSAKREFVDDSILTGDLSNDVSEQAELMPVEGAIKRGSRLLNPLPTRLSVSGPTQPRVAFHAFLSHSELAQSRNLTIIFDSVTINLQNSYNVHNGMFIAPVPGIYAFFFTMRLACSGQHSFQLMKNSEVQGVIYARSENCAGPMSSGSNIVSLQSGDVIYVRTHETYEGAGIIYDTQYGRSHFSGYLIYSEQ